MGRSILLEEKLFKNKERSKWNIIITSGISLIGLYFIIPENIVTQLDGILSPDQPTQINLPSLPDNIITVNNHRITLKAEYKMTALILSRENYHYSAWGNLIPTDLALGWGVMSNQRNTEKIKIKQSNRWYSYRINFKDSPLTLEQIAKHSANVHIIPWGGKVKEKLSSLKKGELIKMDGFLVDAANGKNQTWKTSMTRDDTGAGACELFLVKDIQIIGSGE